jgi:predicted exporter/predicted LPLAT superfamily acyltransferase
MVRRVAAFVWLALVMLACAYLALRIHDGLGFRTDLMALLPREQQDPVLQRADDSVARALSRRIVILVGAADRDIARGGARSIGDALSRSGLVSLTTEGLDRDRLHRIGMFYFPYRLGLLSPGDRQLLMAGRATAIANSARARVFGGIGVSYAGLAANDPFLLLPDFLAALPLPMSKLTLDGGVLSLQAEGRNWVLVSGTINGDPYVMDLQKRLVGVMDEATGDRSAANPPRPDIQVLRLGAVFFAQAAAAQAIGEMTVIGIASTLGILLLVLCVFRALTPLLLTLLAIGVGVLTALSAGLFLFGEMHVSALLLGVSLIGVAVDYTLQYCTEIFAAGAPPPHARLLRVLPGITIGTATTIIGYLTLMLAPFPGLHQIAVFSAVGLLASWLTVVLWFPALDHTRPPRHGRTMLAAAGRFAAMWEAARYSTWRRMFLATLIGVGLFGLARIDPDDNVRRMQSLSPDLVAQQQRLQQLIGSTTSGQFFIVQAADDETALRREEMLIERLTPLVGHALAGFQAPAQYIPSAARQRENRALVAAQLGGRVLQDQAARLGLLGEPAQPDPNGAVLTLADLRKHNEVSFLANLILDADGAALHIVTLDGITDSRALAVAAAPVPGVRLIDPAGDFSVVLGKYRDRAIALLVLSAALMAPLLVWRYGPRGALRVFVAPLLAVALTPSLRALGGAGFTFFDAIGLVLILSIGVDYAVFCAETDALRKPVTMLAVALAAMTALMSFGLIAASGVLAVHAFGSTMAIGIVLAFLLSPIARAQPPPDGPRHWSRLEERGAYLGIQIIVRSYFLLGRTASMALLWPVVLYFYVVATQRRRDSHAYLARVYRATGRAPPGRIDGIRHFMSFARKALESVVAWARPESNALTVIGEADVARLASENRGGLLIVSHLGNAELSRAGLQSRFGQPINVLLHTKHARHYNRTLHRINPSIEAHTIEVTEVGPATAIDLAARVQRGEWIAIAGDRTPVTGFGRTSLVAFLGAPAPFSQGPYILASLMKCPVYALFCLRDRTGHTVYLEKFAERIELPRRDKAASLDGYAARYAALLERYCLTAPLQWYNFFDFWNMDAPVHGGDA